tara:strand:- start:2907 stop:3131 length:225 start_codon:yes stop_codon:yes gene_type:complete
VGQYFLVNVHYQIILVQKKMTKLNKIMLTLLYEDQDGEMQTASKEALTFESAEEALGKLESFFKHQQKHEYIKE